jgi:dipeptidyl aminopeptidase/acylaminoacyl peptidase
LRKLAIALVLFFHAAPLSAAEPDPAGVAVFTRNNRFIDAKISPGGKYFAAISTEGGKRTLVIIDIKTRKPAAAFRPSPESVGNFYWANDSRVIAQIWGEGDGTLAIPSNNGELYALNADTGRGEMIFGYRANVAHVGPAGSTPVADYAGAIFLGRVRGGDDRHVLIETYDFHDAGDRVATLWNMDVYTGRKVQVAAGPMAEASFIADEMGQVRIASGRGPDQKLRFFLHGEKGWDELGKLNGVSRDTRPIGYESQARTLDIVEPLEKGFGVFALNIDTGEKKLLAKNDWVGPSGWLRDRNKKLLAVRFDPDLPDWQFIVPDHPLSRALKGLLAAYPDDDVSFLNTTDDEKKVVALVYSDRNPGRYLLLDVDKLAAEELAARRPWVKADAMSEMTAFHTKASDGLWIHGYVTRPKSAKPGVLPPLIVLPHGGPHGVRDEWGYDGEAQLLASEGFAVLQVNYRGSGGYGEKFQEAGYRHWGDRITQDIIDATRYAIAKGYADPKRVCSYGASFGAFSALQSAILAPDLFRCAVGYAGVYDLTIMASSGDISESRMGKGYVKAVLGSDEEALKRMSPVYNADKLKAKVFLIHGKQDERAPIKHAERMKEALEKVGRPPSWLVEQKEGHGFYDEGARERMYTQLVAFLHENTK